VKHVEGAASLGLNHVHQCRPVGVDLDHSTAIARLYPGLGHVFRDLDDIELLVGPLAGVPLLSHAPLVARGGGQEAPQDGMDGRGKMGPRKRR
jgi:hypothetical protein